MGQPHIPLYPPSPGLLSQLRVVEIRDLDDAKAVKAPGKPLGGDSDLGEGGNGIGMDDPDDTAKEDQNQDGQDREPSFFVVAEGGGLGHGGLLSVHVLGGNSPCQGVSGFSVTPPTAM